MSSIQTTRSESEKNVILSTAQHNMAKTMRCAHSTYTQHILVRLRAKLKHAQHQHAHTHTHIKHMSYVYGERDFSPTITNPLQIISQRNNIVYQASIMSVHTSKHTYYMCRLYQIEWVVGFFFIFHF